MAHESGDITFVLPDFSLEGSYWVISLRGPKVIFFTVISVYQHPVFIEIWAPSGRLRNNFGIFTVFSSIDIC